MTNFDYNLEMLNEIRLIMQGERSGVSSQQGDWQPSDYVDENGNPLPYRQNILTYATETIYNATENYTLNHAYVDRVVETAKKCEELGIDFTVVLPPAHESITEYVIEERAIDDEMTKVLAIFAENNITVIDYEIEKLIEYPEEMYYDGFHLDPVTGLPEFTRQLFEVDLR